MRFKKVYIEITNVCNLKCSFCPQTLRKSKTMSLEDFEKVLIQIKPFTDYIYLHVKGEPLIHSDLGEILDMCEKYNLFVNITTNGTLINKIKDKILNKPALRQINFSLHSFDVNDIYITKKEYITNIINYINESINTIFSLRLWNLDNNNINDKNKEILRIIENEFSLNYHIEDVEINKNGIKLRDKVYLNQDKEFKWPSLSEYVISDNGFCYGLRNQIAILVDGTVVPCCLDGEGVISLGNIFDNSFSNIINSKRASDILEGFSNRKCIEELCKKCGYRTKFDIS